MMTRNFVKTLFAITLCTSISTTYAIQVSVKTAKKDITGIGFTVNGKSHGGMGSEYSAKNMPADAEYSFGLRAHGEDIGCTNDNNEKTIKLTNDSKVELLLTDKKCIFQVS